MPAEERPPPVFTPAVKVALVVGTVCAIAVMTQQDGVVAKIVGACVGWFIGSAAVLVVSAVRESISLRHRR